MVARDIFAERREPKRVVRCERGLWQKLQSISDAEIARAVKPYAGKYIPQLLKRRGLVVDLIRERIATEGEDNVIFDWSSGGSG